MLWNALIGCGLKRVSPSRSQISGREMRHVVGAALLFLTLFAETTSAQIAAPQPVRAATCKAARSAAGRLICVDPDLLALESILGIAYRDAKTTASPEVQQSLLQGQLAWIRERDTKCGLTGTGYKPIRNLLPAKQCLEDAIEARIDELQNSSQTNSISSSTTPAPPTITMTPLVQATSLNSSGGLTANELPSYQRLHFTATTDGVDGTVECSASLPRLESGPLANLHVSGNSIVKIAIADDASSYRMFESDTWGPFLDNLRNAAHSGCANAWKTGRLRNASNGQIDEIDDIFEASTPQGSFLAYSTSLSGPWIVQSNLPKARKQLTADLGIETWVEPAQLMKNPYFFKGSLVGMVINFDRMLSANEAVFTRDGSKIFVSGVPKTLFRGNEPVVLAGRVMGNKGVISKSGSEDLLPALSYVGAHTCDSACAGL